MGPRPYHNDFPVAGAMHKGLNDLDEALAPERPMKAARGRAWDGPSRPIPSRVSIPVRPLLALQGLQPL